MVVNVSLPDNEPQRIAQLLQYKILNPTTPDPFRDITRLATRICSAPIAAVSLVGSTHQWFNSSIGLSVVEMPRDVAFCARAILQPDEVFVIPDTAVDRRFTNNPLVAGEPYVRFYAGAPLTTARGYSLGTLCVMDRLPRELTSEQMEGLQLLGRQLIKQLELQRDLADREFAAERVKAALHESRENHRFVIDNVKEVIFQTDAAGTWTFLNRAWTEITGFSLDETLGTNSSDYIHADDRPQYRQLLEPLDARQRGDRRYELRCRTKTGNYLWVEVHARPIFHGDGSLQGVSGTLDDIDDRQQKEKALREIQERYELAVCFGEVGVWDWNIATDQVYIDPIIKTALGYSDLDIPNTLEGWRSLVHPEDLPQVLQATRSHLQGDTFQYEIEHRRLHKDGSIRWFLSRGMGFADAEDRLCRMTGTDTDITERQLAREALERERRQLQQIIARAPVAIAMFDNQLYCVAHSQKWLEDYGLEGQSIVGRSYDELFPNLPERWKSIYRRSLHGEALSSSEDQWLRTDGSKLYLRWAIEPWYDQDGSVAGIVAVTDIVNELVEARDAALAASRFKSEFLANMSHEIRTPMNAVIGMTGLLLETPLDPEQRDFVETIRISGDALLTLINEILDLSKLEAGEMELEILEFDVSTCIEDVLELLAAGAHVKGLEIAASIHPRVPTNLQGDMGRLRQILMNLTNNAIKFTSRGEVVVRAELVSETVETATIRFAVTDTGIGIPLEKQSQLFSPFTQVDASITRKYGGTGLGLAICKQLVTLMGGEIGINSQLGSGSEFWLTIPFAKPALPAAIEETGYLTNRRLLVVDDNATNCQVLYYQVTRWGMKCDRAESAAGGLKMLKEAFEQNRPYDVAVIDLQMPEMDGLTLGERIKADRRLAGVPLILLTSTNRRDEASRSLDIGFAAYLVKPARASRLFNTIVNVLRESLGTDFAKPPDIASVNPIWHPEQPSTGLQPATLRILLAEDNLVNQKVALKQLHTLGYDADVAATGEEVLQLLEKVPYDLILMDCQMPILDGYETTKEIHRRYSRRPAIVAMTANAMKSDQEKCLNAGMDDYLSKPVSKESLTAILERWSRVKEEAVAEPLSDLEAIDTERQPGIDWQLLHSVSDNDTDFELELLNLFVDNARTHLELMREAIANRDFQQISQSAHQLKGSSGNLGVTSIHAIAKKLEEITGPDQLSERASLLSSLSDSLQEIQAFLNKEFSN